MPKNVDNYLKNIEIKGAKVHNLKNVTLDIPRNKLIVITGLSGSGKSSLAFDTLYAEGQRRYVESLSSYARQFLGRMQKPEVDYIKGIPPAIAIEQKVNTRNPRSTVGTSTEIYDYLKLLYARIGKTYSPVSGKEVKKDSITDVVNFISSLPEGLRMMLMVDIPFNDQGELYTLLNNFLNQGLSRIEYNGETLKIEEYLKAPPSKTKNVKCYLIIDRFTASDKNDAMSRFADSVQQAYRLGDDQCFIKTIPREGDNVTYSFSNRFDMDGINFQEPDVHLFSFNNPLGACPVCEGYGKIIGIDTDLVIPDKSLSIYEDAIVCWKGDVMKAWKERLIRNADKFNFPIHKPFYELTKEQKDLLWKGNKHFRGLNAFFRELESKKYKIQYRVMLSRYRGKTTCTECDGTRLKKEAGYVKVGGKPLQELVLLPIWDLQEFIENIALSPHEQKIAGRILIEVKNRLNYICDVGLGYLTLNRISSSLSGGESQRINLATSLGSSLVGSLYILDEPSIGLHPRDTGLLVKVLKQLRNLGNTVIVVEHEEEVIRSADYLIDIGPEAGRLGGEVIFAGPFPEMTAKKPGLTAAYLTHEKIIDTPSYRRKWNNSIKIEGARENNLKNIQVQIPLQVFAVISGVSGSGKSTLVKNILYPALGKILLGQGEKTGEHDRISGDIKMLEHIEFVDQNPIGKSTRSNPVTYVKAYDEIRKLFSQQNQSKLNGYKPSHFSFNVDGGRCEECQGEGEITVEMQFMADVHLVCDSCGGKRFKQEILEVEYNGNNIFDVLDMTINEAIEFFGNDKSSLSRKVVSKLKPLADVGLGYVKLGQSSSTLSGGESQRVKLASFLGLGTDTKRTLFIFDEPTTGLHFHDIKKLLDSFNALIEQGHSVLVIEHNMEIIKNADWIIDLGPEGGDNGGYIVVEGTPEIVAKNESSYTGKYLAEKLNVSAGVRG
jgi:excinuclease ABC subunit A